METGKIMLSAARGLFFSSFLGENLFMTSTCSILILLDGRRARQLLKKTKKSRPTYFFLQDDFFYQGHGI